MLYKNYKNTAVSALGMGCIRLPKKEDGKIDYNKAEEISDYAYVMETGRITMAGPGKELLTDDRVKKAYLGE